MPWIDKSRRNTYIMFRQEMGTFQICNVCYHYYLHSNAKSSQYFPILFLDPYAKIYYSHFVLNIVLGIPPIIPSRRLFRNISGLCPREFPLPLFYFPSGIRRL